MIIPENTTILRTAIAILVIGWPIQATATDFALKNNLLTVTNAVPNKNLKVDADGRVTAPLTIPIGPEDYGMPSFTFGLNASDILTGEHIFWAAVEITGNGNDKYIRAFLDEVFITVADGGTFSGEIKAATNLTVRVESEGDFLQIELDDQAGDSVAFAGDSLQFDASNLLELLGAADGQSSLWQDIAEDFTTADNFTYKIYLGPRSYGVQGARIGITNTDGFLEFPLRPAAFLANDEGYVIEGGFSTSNNSTSSQLPKVVSVDGSETDASFTSSASTIGGGTFADEFTTADDVTIVGTVNVDPDDQGFDGEVYVAILTRTDDGATLSYLNEAGQPELWSPLTFGALGAHIVATPLSDFYNITVFSGNLAAGTHRVALAYATENGNIIYAPKAIIITVTE